MVKRIRQRAAALKGAGALDADMISLLGQLLRDAVGDPTDPEAADLLQQFADWYGSEGGDAEEDAAEGEDEGEEETTEDVTSDVVLGFDDPTSPIKFSKGIEPIVKKTSKPADPEEEPQVKPPQLAPYDIDIPEEPEKVRVVVQEWDPLTRAFLSRDMGLMTLVPTGCRRPIYLSPYENKVSLRSALPRDKEKDTNLYATWQQNGWIDRHLAMEKLEEGINIQQVDKRIADDMPFILALQGKPDSTGQVAQTNGLQQPGDGPGDNNGAPLPPGPGPGRGNKFAPGDNLGG
jgi:hypothetical protein